MMRKCGGGGYIWLLVISKLMRLLVRFRLLFLFLLLFRLGSVKKTTTKELLESDRLLKLEIVYNDLK